MKYFGGFVIPDIGKNSSILLIVIFTELFAIIGSLLFDTGNVLATLGFVSIYLHWIVLLAVALLCVFKAKLNSKPALVTVFGATLCCFLSFCVIEVFSQYVNNKFSLALFDWKQFWRLSGAALVCIFVILRLFAVIALIEQRNKSEMSMKLHALQSRIKPHFLFNSLNTISELIATEPKHAEQAVGSLAMLFRASLENDDRFHSLDNETGLCKRYLELERWRLGERLSVKWNVDVERANTIKVPKLIIQPLLENAVIYGVQENGNVEVDIDIKESKQHLSIMIKNIKGVSKRLNNGNGIAVDNIRERLFVLYDDQQTFSVRDNDLEYRVLMRFSKYITNGIS